MGRKSCLITKRPDTRAQKAVKTVMTVEPKKERHIDAIVLVDEGAEGQKPKQQSGPKISRRVVDTKEYDGIDDESLIDTLQERRNIEIKVIEFLERRR